jgi:hypothetical protein
VYTWVKLNFFLEKQTLYSVCYYTHTEVMCIYFSSYSTIERFKRPGLLLVALNLSFTKHRDREKVPLKAQ